jgi:diguanylate cyclase (GGDEF)-like protein
MGTAHRPRAAPTLPRPAVGWIALVCAAAVVAVAWVVRTHPWSPILDPWLLLVVAVAVGTFEWPLHRLNRARGLIDPWMFLGPTVVWLLGTPATLVAALVAMLGSLALDRRPLQRWPFNVAVRSLAVVGAAVVMELLSGSASPRPAQEIGTVGGLVAVVAAVAVWWLVSWTCVSVVTALASRQSVRHELLDGAGTDAGAAALFSSVGPIILLALAFQPWLLPLLALPVAGALVNANRAQRHHLEARTDPLSGLPNRLAIYEAIGDRVRADSWGGRRFGVCMVDLNGFKQINDDLGHAMGDRVLERLSARLRALSSDSLLIGRLGGDEFTVVWRDDADRSEYERRAEELRAVIRTPLAVGTGEVRLDAALGLAVHPEDGADVSELLRQADLDMYREKRELRFQ